MSARLIIGDLSAIKKRGYMYESYVSPRRTANDIERDARDRYRIPDEAICARTLDSTNYMRFDFTWYEVTIA
jgi:hypothetical protein